VSRLEGDHAAVVAEVENKVVAVDLSVWLVQAQTQPALVENFSSPQAAVLKVVFDRVSQWLGSTRRVANTEHVLACLLCRCCVELLRRQWNLVVIEVYHWHETC